MKILDALLNFVDSEAECGRTRWNLVGRDEFKMNLRDAFRRALETGDTSPLAILLNKSYPFRKATGVLLDVIFGMGVKK